MKNKLVPLNPAQVGCPQAECVARGQVGQGNIRVHSQPDRRYKCEVCGKTFAETKGTPFYRAHKDHEQVVRVTTLLAYGCPPAAIVAAFEGDARTVKRYPTAAGQHCQALHEYLVEQPRNLGQVQMDEIWVKVQGLILWLAMAIQVETRLWLGAAVSPRRDRALLTALLKHVRASALCRPLLFCVDGLSAYIKAIQHTFREPLYTGTPGRPRLRPWDGIYIAQMVKQSTGRCVTGILQRVKQGTVTQVHTLIQLTQGHGGINTAYIERINATFRSRLAPLVRRTRHRVRQATTLHDGVYLVGGVYNFCTYHHSLRVELLLPHNQHRWLQRTPANAAGIADHRWTVSELLWFKVPQPPVLPKRRGRPSKDWLALKKRWLG